MLEPPLCLTKINGVGLRNTCYQRSLMPRHWYPDRANATLQRRATADEPEAQIKGYIRSRADQLAHILE